MTDAALSRWQPYPDYKPTGVEWLGDIPSQWTTSSVKHVFSIQLGKMLQNTPNGPADRLVPYLKALHVQWGQVNLDDLPEMWASPKDIGTYSVTDSDLLVCEGGEVGRAAILNGSPVQCVIQNALHRVRSSRITDTCYLRYLLQGIAELGWFEVLCNRATIAHLTRDKLGAIRMPLPSLEEQRAIAAFLDRETTHLDALIAKKQRLIELLQEQRTALISQVVTKGLDPNVAMKDSGIRWLGIIPAHWGVRRLKMCIRYGTSISYGIVQPGEHLDEGVPFVQTTNITGEELDLSALQLTSPAIEAAYPRSKLRQGDVILGIRASIGAAHVVPQELAGANLSRGIARIVTDNSLVPTFLMFFLRCREVQEYWRLFKQGSTFNEVSIETVRELPILLPPIAEQERISAWVKAKDEALKLLIDTVRVQIDRLREYRTALISAAVTGKIKVFNG
jgi:type I restriction enzyme, S subunit